MIVKIVQNNTLTHQQTTNSTTMASPKVQVLQTKTVVKKSTDVSERDGVMNPVKPIHTETMNKLVLPTQIPISITQPIITATMKFIVRETTVMNHSTTNFQGSVTRALVQADDTPTQIDARKNMISATNIARDQSREIIQPTILNPSLLIKEVHVDSNAAVGKATADDIPELINQISTPQIEAASNSNWQSIQDKSVKISDEPVVRNPITGSKSVVAPELESVIPSIAIPLSFNSTNPLVIGSTLLSNPGAIRTEMSSSEQSSNPNYIPVIM